MAATPQGAAGERWRGRRGGLPSPGSRKWFRAPAYTPKPVGAGQSGRGPRPGPKNRSLDGKGGGPTRQVSLSQRDHWGNRSGGAM